MDNDKVGSAVRRYNFGKASGYEYIDQYLLPRSLYALYNLKFGTLLWIFFMLRLEKLRL